MAQQQTPQEVPQTTTALSVIKTWFKTGLKPTQNQFWAWMDSFWHKDEKIPINSINGLSDVIEEKVDKVPGKGLSEQNYTADEKEKLNIIQLPTDLGTYDSMEEALNAIGENKFFLWSEDNKEGVISPHGTVVGVTKTLS